MHYARSSAVICRPRTRGSTPRPPPADPAETQVVGLGGNVAERLRTGFYSYEHSAWTRAGSRLPLPASADTDAPRRALRGGDWASFSLFATGSARRARPVLTQDEAFGFRCSRPGR